MRLALACTIVVLCVQAHGAFAATHIPCTEEGTANFGPGGDAVTVVMRNDMTQTVSLYGVLGGSRRTLLGTLEPDKEIRAPAQLGATLVATDAAGTCIGIYRADTPKEDLFDISPDPLYYQYAGTPPAVELLARAIKCPLDVRTIPDPFSGAISRVWLESRQARFFGTASRFEMILHKQQFDTSRTSGTRQYRTLREVIAAPLVSGTQVAQAGAIVTLSCDQGAKCIADQIGVDADKRRCPSDRVCDGDPEEGPYRSETDASLSKTNIRFCDESAASDAMAALSMLLKGN